MHHSQFEIFSLNVVNLWLEFMAKVPGNNKKKIQNGKQWVKNNNSMVNWAEKRSNSRTRSRCNITSTSSNQN